MTKRNAITFMVMFSAVLLSFFDSSMGFSSQESRTFLPIVFTNTPTPPPDAYDWPMAGANVERTSWVTEEVRGSLKPEWYSHIDAYISQKVQIIAASGYLFISASDGLHALSAESGNEIWFYSTDLPLGHSPSFHNGMVYVGGMDRKIHAIDVQTGQNKWVFEAEAGFQTNPLIVGGLIYAGNRDGYLYAIYEEGDKEGELAWKYKTDGPILNSAAYKGNVVYFASNDMHAYALNAKTGDLIWKSDKLPGYGFSSFWPVIYGDIIVFSGSWNYRFVQPGPDGNHNLLERLDVYPPNALPGDSVGPFGTEPGNWAPGTRTINAFRITDYFEEKPHRRTYIALRLSSGQEYTFDSDGDGNLEYAPILYFGAKAGTRYPPAVGQDGVIYQANNYIYEDWIPRGQVSGWKIGTQFISVPSPYTNAVDEPLGFSIGGNVVYSRLCCDREASAFDLTTGEKWVYYDQGGIPLRRTLPNLFEEGWDFAYWKHGDPSAPIPYNDRVYVIVNNAVVALSSDGLDPVLPYNEDLGRDLGELASNVEKSTVITGLNSKITLENTSWPLLIQQERYYEISPNPLARARYTRLFEVAGSASGLPSSLSSSSTTITTELTSTFGGNNMQTWISKRSPAVLFNNSNNTYELRGNLVGVAFVSGGNIEVVDNSSTIFGSEIDESWLLVWDDTEDHRWLPVVISLQNRPNQVTIAPDSISLSYTGSAGFLGITPLYGMSAPLSTETTTWFSGIPSQTLSRIRTLNKAARYFPDESSESRFIDAIIGDVTLTYDYNYIHFEDDWSTLGLRIAYLPTTLALAAWNDSPIRINNQPLSNHLDLEYVTPLGRVAGVENVSSISVRLPGLANYWHNFQEDSVSVDQSDPLLEELINEIEKMVAVGHLRPGYGIHGIWDSVGSSGLGQYLADFYHNPADTYYTLLMALPLLPGDTQELVRQYLQLEFQTYPPSNFSHTGWDNGSSRNFFDLPPEVEAATSSFSSCGVCNSWGFPGENFYASYLYAKTFGNAEGIFSDVENKLDDLPDFSQSFPHRLNSKLIGYIGNFRLAKLAGVDPESAEVGKIVDLFVVRAALSKYPSALEATGFEYGGNKWSVRTSATNGADSLFTPRIIGTLWSQMPLYGFPKNQITGLSGGHTGGGYSFGIDYYSLVPELAAFLDAYAHDDVKETVDDYSARAPYWFVAQAQEIGGEGVMVPIYDVVSIFQARAMILGESRSNLEKYLDVPVMKTGDLYYMLNLIATLKSSP